MAIHQPRVTARSFTSEVRELKKEKWKNLRQGVGLGHDFWERVENLKKRAKKILVGKDLEIFERAVEEQL